MELIKYKEDDLILDMDEGVNDPGIFKAIILAGGPGSGKTFVARELGLKSLGLIVVNSDNYFELLMKRKGLSLKMPDNEFEDREAARLAAKGLTDKRYNSLIAARMGILIDSTSGNQGKTFKMYRELKNWGYDVKSIFIQTDLEVAMSRNNERSRTIPPKILEKSHKAAQAVRKMLKKSMGRNYHEVENNAGPIDKGISGKLTTWASKPNNSALEWIAAVKRGMDSSVREDLNNTTMNRFKEFIEIQEALNMQQRLARGRVAKRSAKKRARSAKKKSLRVKSPADMLKKAGMMARGKLAMKLSGGVPMSQMTISQKMQIAKKLEKKKAAIAKLTKKLLPGARKADKERIAGLRGK